MSTKYFSSIVIMLLVSLAVTSCSKSLSDRPPVDEITVENFYQTNAQVQASTLALYSAPWFGYNTKASWAITEMFGGNGRSYSSDVVNFGNFSVTNTNFEMESGWNSLFTVVAQANALINTLPTKVSSAVD